MKKLIPVLLIPIIPLFLAPSNASADGMFVVPKFAWDKHKDINEPAQKAIMVYDAGREDLVLQVKYEGPVDEFGWLIPVPNLPTVQKGSMKCFYELSQFTQRHFETAWRHRRGAYETLSAGMDSAKSEPLVKVIEIKTVGAYEIAVLSTKDASALENWLNANQFYFPINKADVLDSYVKQQWYFVAVKINLGKSDGFQLVTESPKGKEAPKSSYSTELKLANGELNPLQISFASDRCVFPLKISSINGRPSEVQVYVLSLEPLLERMMLEKKLPLIYSNNMARAAERAQSYREIQARRMEMLSRSGGFGRPPDPDKEKTIQKMSEELYVGLDELLPYAKVTKADLPDSSRCIPRLAAKSWWLTKQTWTFQPEEMRDLEFEPAIPVFAGMLGTKYGYYTSANLDLFQADAVPTLLAALQNTNLVVRVNAASAFDNQTQFSDPRVKEAAISWLKDSEPKVRTKAVHVLTDYSSWNPKFAEALVPALRDEDAEVRHAVAMDLLRLPQFRDDLRGFIPAFQEMFRDTNPVVRVSGLKMMLGMELPIERDALISFFKIPDREGISLTLQQFRKADSRGGNLKYDISDEEAVPLLQNSEQLARMIGLNVLYKNAEKQSVELALPLLKVPDELVRVKAAQTLRALTGQHFTDEQADEWGKWWVVNKTNFVVELHPEELRPQHRGTNDIRWYLTNRPPPSAENPPR